MSQHKNKFKNILSFIFVSLAVACALAGCRDELLYSPTDIPDADVDMVGEVVFRPLVATEVQTRAGDTQAPAGASYKGIKTLYIFFFDQDKKLIKEYTGPVSFRDASTESSTLQRVKFDMRVHAGKYYVYAVANMDATALNALKNKDGVSISDLKNLKLDWNDNLAEDLEMFGVFQTSGSESKPEEVENSKFEYDKDAYDESVTITPTSNTIHSWVRRAVSKVTVDFDGSLLKEGVTVYIEKAVLKDLSSGAFLGAQSKATNAAQKEGTVEEGETSSADGFSIIEDSKYALIYGKGTDAAQWPQVTKTGVFKPKDVWIAANAWTGMKDDSKFHDDDAWALPCYENMQGDGTEEYQKYQDKNGDGIIDSYHKDNMPYGTYLEVTGYYKSDRPEYKSEGPIVYRFMLGQDAEKNFDLIRNHHYKITMNFKDYGNDIDWHIEYKNRVLEATYPEDVNYRGEFFNPEGDRGVPNAGHSFSGENKILVTTYESDNKSTTPVAIESITYTYSKWNSVTNTWVPVDKPAQDDSNHDWGWLSETHKTLDGTDETQIEYTFKAAQSIPIVEDMNTKLKASSGSGNLGETETANSYIVNGHGTYTIPLVYGNKNIGGAHFVNYKGATITDANILTDIGKTASDLEARVIWQDVDGLVTVNSVLQGNYISFTVNSDKIKQGNAVIALIDRSLTNNDGPQYTENGVSNPYIQGDNTNAVWSWHIWVTRFGSDDFEKNIMVHNHQDAEYDVLPVNLGWCSGDDPVLYFPRRKCDITFTTERGDEIKRTIMQYPHFALTRGDHPYYQWGRKDPFVGTRTAWGNKPRWVYEKGKTALVAKGTGSGDNPPRMFNEPTLGTQSIWRKNTQECLNELIKNPDKWHNAPRTAVDKKVDEGQPGYENWLNHVNGFYSNNQSYDDLWNYNNGKTIYDPCPPGYRVESDDVFSGFTATGRNHYDAQGIYIYDVLEKYMCSDYEYEHNGDKKTLSYKLSPNANVIEFYADTRRLQSVPFPVTGYRDYDQTAIVNDYPIVHDETYTVPESGDPVAQYNGQGYVWSNRARTGAHEHDYWLNGSLEHRSMNGTCSYHFKYKRDDLGTGDWKSRVLIVAPREDFYDTDGFAVRPVSTTSPTPISKENE